MKIFRKIIQFFKEAKTELSKVVWPTKKEAIKMTIMVIIGSIFVAIFLGSFDFLFMKIVEFILKK